MSPVYCYVITYDLLLRMGYSIYRRGVLVIYLISPEMCKWMEASVMSMAKQIHPYEIQCNNTKCNMKHY